MADNRPMLRIGILGAARIAARAMIHPAREVPSATVAAVAARDEARANAFAVQHAIPVAYGSYEELLADSSIDAVYIPLPNALHAPWTLRAIEAGKHVLCEKPFTANLREAEEVLSKAHNSGLVVMEAMHYRYHPLAQRMATMIRDGAIGTPRHVQCWTIWPVPDLDDIRYSYEMAGGALMDAGCYAIDCLRLAGLSEPEVSDALADPMPADPRVDRALAARLVSPSGLTGWFESAFTRGGDFRADVHVSGDEGELFLRNFVLAHEGSLTLYPNGPTWPEEDADLGAPGDTTFAWQLRAFTTAIQEGAPFQTTVAHAVTTMRVIDDAYRAAGLPLRGFAGEPSGNLPVAGLQQHPGDELGSIGHRHVPAAGEQDEARVRNVLAGDVRLADREQPVLGAPGDGHRHVGGDRLGEVDRLGENLVERVRGAEERDGVTPGLLGAQLRGPGDDRGVENGPPGGTARELRRPGAEALAGELHGLEDRLGVVELPRRRPEAGGRQAGHGRGPSARSGAEGERAAE